MRARALVTGAAGLLGGATLPALRGIDIEVFPVTRNSMGLAGEIVCELEDPTAVRRAMFDVGPTHVIHLAGGTAGTPDALYRRNVLTTANVLEAAADLPGKPHCVIVGSAAEYGEVEGHRVAESAALRPVTEYGRSKVDQTTLGEDIAARRRLVLTILRPFNVVSPQLPDSTALGRIRRELFRSSGPERRVRCGRLDVVRDYVPVSVFVQIVLRLFSDPVPRGAINVCSGVGIALEEVLEAMARRLQVVARVECDPELAALPAAPRVVGDPTRLQALVGTLPRVSADTVAALMIG